MTAVTSQPHTDASSVTSKSWQVRGKNSITDGANGVAACSTTDRTSSNAAYTTEQRHVTVSHQPTQAA